jgi:hypothetical protein
VAWPKYRGSCTHGAAFDRALHAVWHAATGEETAMATRTDEPRGDTEAGVGATYRTLEEQEGRLSPSEQRFERRRRDVGLWLAPLLFFVVLLLPLDLE